MQSKQIAKSKPGPPTQRYLDIAEVREDIVVMKDGTLRAVLMVSSINFALKSAEEQQAIIQSYMQFLNGIEYPIQVVIQSRKMNIDKYMQSLEDQEKKIDNQLLKVQIADYRSFVADLVELGEIMQKRFYVVVPYDPATDKKQNFWTRVQSAIMPASIIKLKEKDFQSRKQTLMQRMNVVQGGLTSMGLQSVVLDTESLIELYYTVYNPEVFDRQKLKDTKQVRIESGF
ncbi:hypothetical protein KJ766_01325 [Patescibacteria group bacterium]|nr:hypothetical protein [Patescibacteria group bacterium]